MLIPRDMGHPYDVRWPASRRAMNYQPDFGKRCGGGEENGW
jgi:hypothetical protein